MSTESLIESPGQSRSWIANWSSWILFIALFYVVVGLSPYSKAKVLDSSGGDLSNQLLWGVMALMGLAVAVKNSAETQRLLRRSWPLLLALAWIAMTILWAPYKDLSIRRVGVLFTVAMVGLGLALTCRDPVRYFKTMVLLSGAVMSINVIGLIILPGLSMAGDAVVGMHPHKNTAGQVALVSYIVWFVAAGTARDLRWRIIFGVGTVVWFGFLVLTQSKTSLGIAVLTPFVMAAIYAIARAQGLVRFVFVALLVAGITAVWTGLLGIGITSIAKLMQLVFSDLTFTGRTALWEFLWSQANSRPLSGLGYGSFWDTGLRFSPINFADGWAAVAGQAHNGYLDLIVQVGYVGLALVLWCVGRVLFLAMRLTSTPNISSEELGAYLVAVALFIAIALLNFMESSYFRGFHYLSVQFFFLYFFVEQWSERARLGSVVADGN